MILALTLLEIKKAEDGWDICCVGSTETENIAP